nr:MAG TPA: InsA N-terminal domain [Caudoviricetes sp.]
MFCKCGEKSKMYPLPSWRIIRYKYTPCGYSRIVCKKCGCTWISRAAKYVEKTQNDEKRLFNQ